MDNNKQNVDFNSLLNMLRPRDRRPEDHFVCPHVIRADIVDLSLADTVALINFFIDRYNIAVRAVEYREQLLHVYRSIVRDQDNE